jgi:hypothetical protein
MPWREATIDENLNFLQQINACGIIMIEICMQTKSWLHSSIEREKV